MPLSPTETASGSPRPASAWRRVLRAMVDVRDDEVGTLALACGYFFCLLAAWFILRPIREQTGIAGGTRNLPWLMAGTLIATLIVHPPFAAIVARWPRQRFITVSYRFFVANLLIFFALFRGMPDDSSIWVGRVFYVWTSVFNLFVTSVFWAFMVDVFRTDQAKRLFGFIGIGGTLGGIFGSALTARLAAPLGPTQLLLLSALLLELAVQCVRRLNRAVVSGTPFQGTEPEPVEAVIGGTSLAGIAHVLRSPYLINMSLYMLLFTIGSTILYFQQAQIVESHFTDRAAQTTFFANLDLAVQILTAATQAFLTGRLIKTFGLPFTLALLPVITVLGSLAMGLAPATAIVGVFVAFQVIRRAGEYSYARPAREVLYTVLTREDKYKAKHFIDTFIYRGGDQLGAWGMTGLFALGLGLTETAVVAIPIALLWVVIAVWLGRRHQSVAVGGH